MKDQICYLLRLTLGNLNFCAIFVLWLAWQYFTKTFFLCCAGVLASKMGIIQKLRENAKIISGIISKKSFAGNTARRNWAICLQFYFDLWLNYHQAMKSNKVWNYFKIENLNFFQVKFNIYIAIDIRIILHFTNKWNKTEIGFRNIFLY